MLTFAFDAVRNEAKLGGASHVFHCHFYNTALHKAVEDGLGDRAAEVLWRRGASSVAPQLRALCAESSDHESVKTTASELFRTLGFGKLDVSGLGAAGGAAIVQASHYALGWVSVYGERTAPVCAFPVGFVAATASVAFDRPLETIHARETACFACGSENCVIEVEFSK